MQIKKWEKQVQSKKQNLDMSVKVSVADCRYTRQFNTLFLI